MKEKKLIIERDIEGKIIDHAMAVCMVALTVSGCVLMWVLTGLLIGTCL